ncbi:VOC family protein [Piscinibacter sakaiensis]|uniref:Lactoylglutathione lyase n=1 Tax=Piscinibacter sakaiensis TaxID=1547922 RepID=A0A0K8P251_PISS1|nr:VOC family protein [Piscinibacter sakaiensis]GAP36245.1 lactoylglutathione lyase [Piscinibacter sakaiensis]
MRPRISLVTLGVDDLDAALRFYRDGLGLPTDGIVGQDLEHGAVAFFELEGGLGLALWPRASLAHDTGLALAGRGQTPALTLAHNVRTPGEVATVLEQAEAAGARIVRPAAEAFWGGVSGVFQDPDGYLWEVAWNPERLPEEPG